MGGWAVPIDGFSDFVFDDGGISHRVYRRGTGPAVIVMHELPGLTPQCITLGNEIAAKGFSVFLPLLFGEPGDNHPYLFGVKVCVSREIYLLAQKGGSPIVNWLRALGRKALDECGGPGIGVIGLCLTGNFAISLLASPFVLAPVSSEPALPFGFTDAAQAAIAVTDAELAGAVARARQGTPLICLRFSEDWKSPKARFEAIRAAFGDAFRGTEIDSGPGNEWNIPSSAHSVLTEDFVITPGHPTREALDEVLKFLRTRLGVSGGMSQGDSFSAVQTGRAE
jgi:dienelactone hydrolase